jgi:hypothetical protein
MMAVPAFPDLVWRQRATEAVVQQALKLQAQGRHLLLSGDPVAAGEVLATPSAVGLDGVAVCLLDGEPRCASCAAHLPRRRPLAAASPQSVRRVDACPCPRPLPHAARAQHERVGRNALGPVERTGPYRWQVGHGGAGHLAADTCPSRRRDPDVVQPRPERHSDHLVSRGRVNEIDLPEPPAKTTTSAKRSVVRWPLARDRTPPRTLASVRWSIRSETSGRALGLLLVAQSSNLLSHGSMDLHGFRRQSPGMQSDRAVGAGRAVAMSH